MLVGSLCRPSVQLGAFARRAPFAPDSFKCGVAMTDVSEANKPPEETTRETVMNKAGKLHEIAELQSGAALSDDGFKADSLENMAAWHLVFLLLLLISQVIPVFAYFILACLFLYFDRRIIKRLAGKPVAWDIVVFCAVLPIIGVPMYLYKRENSLRRSLSSVYVSLLLSILNIIIRFTPPIAS
jgi:hypothetical protein